MPSKHHFASLKMMEVLKKTHTPHNKSAALVLENGEVLYFSSILLIKFI